jgi:hypothetical protein
VRLGGLGQLKTPITSSGIETATFRLVVLWPNRMRYRVPPVGSIGTNTSIIIRETPRSWITSWPQVEDRLRKSQYTICITNRNGKAGLPTAHKAPYSEQCTAVTGHWEPHREGRVAQPEVTRPKARAQQLFMTFNIFRSESGDGRCIIFCSRGKTPSRIVWCYVGCLTHWKWSGKYSSYYPNICLEKLKKATKIC